jgi:integrase
VTVELRHGALYSRFRFGAGQRGRFRMDLDPKDPSSEAVAADRDARLQRLAQAMAKARLPGAAQKLADLAAVASSERKFRTLEKLAEELIGQAPTSAPPPPTTLATFRDVVEAWTSGKLAEDFHDDVEPKTEESRADDRTILRAFYPVLADLLLRDVTEAQIQEAYRCIPRHLHANTRRLYRQRLRFVFQLAVTPLRLIERAPLIELPRKKASNLFGFLYPQEEAALAMCEQVPLVFRVLYAFLARNGTRLGETLKLTWDHVDLDTGRIHIDKAWTKTGRARHWVLDADVKAALETWSILSGAPDGNGRVFVFPGRSRGKRLSMSAVQHRFIEDLRAAGVTRQLALEGADGIQRLRPHDLRASFVTLALRAGRDLKWITARTGHEAISTIKIYDRLIQDANELALPPWFEPMDQAIPEIRRARRYSSPPSGVGPQVGPGAVLPEENALLQRLMRTAETAGAGEKDPQKPSETTTAPSPSDVTGPASFPQVGPTGPRQQVGPEPPQSTTEHADVGAPGPVADSPVEQALAYALRAATDQGRWDVVLEVTRELSERRRARVAPAVPSLSDARAKRNGDKP